MQRGESVGQPVGEELGREESERRLGALASAKGPGALHLHLTHGPFPLGPKASGSPVLTVNGGERVITQRVGGRGLQVDRHPLGGTHMP